MKLKSVEKTLPPLTYVELLNRALQATGNPERYAKTLLSAMVKAEVGGEAMAAFALYVRGEPELHLVGAEAAPQGDDRVLSPAGNACDVAGVCRADVRSSRRHRFGIFEEG